MVAGKQQIPFPGTTNLSPVKLTLADTYGLGLIAYNENRADKAEIFAHLSPAAQKIVKEAEKQYAPKKSASKRRRAAKK